ncbi:MAG: terminase small subunit [Erysipelotrichaceae bacterium]
MEEKQLRIELDMLRDKMRPMKVQFCEEYQKNGGNGTQACKSAGYSPNSSYAQATRLLKEDNVKKYISILQQLTANHFEVDRADIINKLTDIAFSGNYPTNQQMEAMKMLNQMNGWNAPSKTETTINHSGDVESIAERLATMTPDEKRAELLRMKNELN